MKVFLKTGYEADSETYSQEMSEEVFAMRVAKVASSQKPTPNCEHILTPAFFVKLLGQNPEVFEKRGNLLQFPTYPHRTTFRFVAEGSMILITLAKEWPPRPGYEYFFVRKMPGNKLKLLRPAKNYTFCPGAPSIENPSMPTIREGDPLWPWVAFYPQRFSGALKLLEFLTPAEENPLTGLLTSKDGAVRTLAKMTVSHLRETYLQLIKDIVSSL